MTKHIIISILAALGFTASTLAMFFLLNPAFIFVGLVFFKIFEDQMQKISHTR